MATKRIEAAPGDVVRHQQGDTVLARPIRVERPTTVDEVVAAVSRAAREGAVIRAAGAGLSLTGLATGPAVVIDLTGLRGLIGVDTERRTATFLAGTTVDEAQRELERRGAALVGAPANGDATLAGALSTGAHGFAPREGSFSAAAVGAKLVTPNGALVPISERANAQLWPAARLSLGALGVIAEVTVRIRPAAPLSLSRKRRDIGRLLRDLPEARAKSDYYRVDWRPHTDEALLTVGWYEEAGTRAVRSSAAPVAPALPAAPGLPPVSALPAAEERPRARRRDRIRARLARALPFLAPVIDRVATRFEPTGVSAPRAARLVAEPGAAAPFVEYQFAQADAARAVDVVRELAARDRRLAAADARITLVAADEVWLSASYGRDVVAVRVQVPAAERAALELVEDAFLRAGGLPTWGGLHTITAAEAAHVMPRFGDFGGIRHDLDPYDRMHNAALGRVLG